MKFNALLIFIMTGLPFHVLCHDLLAPPGGIQTDLFSPQVYVSSDQFGKRYLSALMNVFGNLDSLCAISSVALHLHLNRKFGIPLLTDANRATVSALPAYAEIKIGYHIDQLTGQYSFHHWLVLTQNGKKYFLDAVHTAMWASPLENRFIFEEIRSPDQLEKRYNLYEITDIITFLESSDPEVELLLQGVDTPIVLMDTWRIFHSGEDDFLQFISQWRSTSRIARVLEKLEDGTLSMKPGILTPPYPSFDASGISL